MTTISLRVKEYDTWDGCSACVNNEIYTATWLGNTEKTVRNFLAGGDYSVGDDKRYVEVYVNCQLHGEYSAPRIRRFRHRAGTR
jgi:hypothetical protein